MAHSGHIIIPGYEGSLEQHTKQEYGDAAYTAKPDGLLFLDDKEIAATMMCCHCGMHWILKKGSGIKRGFCLRHMKVTCGQQKCVECSDYEASVGL